MSREGGRSAAQRIGWAALPLTSFILGYYVVPQLRIQASVWDPSLPFDSKLPCVPWLAWIYLVGLVVPLLPACAMPISLLPRTACTYIALIAASALVFVLVPTDGRALRTQCVTTPSWPLEVIHRLDAPANLFPSLHVGFAVLAALCLRHVGARWALTAMALAGIEAVSVCLVKQHFIADAMAGAVFAILAYVTILVPGGRRLVGASIQRSCHLALTHPRMKVGSKVEEHLPKAAVGMVVRLPLQHEPVVLTCTPDCCP